jgi:hypothetical protein
MSMMRYYPAATCLSVLIFVSRAQADEFTAIAVGQNCHAASASHMYSNLEAAKHDPNILYEALRNCGDASCKIVDVVNSWQDCTVLFRTPSSCHYSGATRPKERFEEAFTAALTSCEKRDKQSCSWSWTTCPAMVINDLVARAHRIADAVMQPSTPPANREATPTAPQSTMSPSALSPPQTPAWPQSGQTVPKAQAPDTPRQQSTATSTQPITPSSRRPEKHAERTYKSAEGNLIWHWCWTTRNDTLFVSDFYRYPMNILYPGTDKEANWHAWSQYLIQESGRAASQGSIRRDTQYEPIFTPSSPPSNGECIYGGPALASVQNAARIAYSSARRLTKAYTHWSWKATSQVDPYVPTNTYE